MPSIVPAGIETSVEPGNTYEIEALQSYLLELKLFASHPGVELIYVLQSYLLELKPAVRWIGQQGIDTFNRTCWN